MRTNIEERAVEIALYIIENNATVRSAAAKIGVSKSTVHTVIVKWNGLCGGSDSKYQKVEKIPAFAESTLVSLCAVGYLYSDVFLVPAKFETTR